MQRRAELERQGAPPRRYFAYSTVLDHAAFEEWGAQHAYGFFQLPEGIVAEALDLDLVYDFPSRWWGGRVAGLDDRPGTTVFGRLFEIAGADWPIVQHKEGLITAMCVERPVRVRAGGELVEATAFTTRPERASLDGPVSARFVEALVRGARAAALPEVYIARLERAACWLQIPSARGASGATLVKRHAGSRDGVHRVRGLRGRIRLSREAVESAAHARDLGADALLVEAHVLGDDAPEVILTVTWSRRNVDQLWPSPRGRERRMYR